MSIKELPLVALFGQEKISFSYSGLSIAIGAKKSGYIKIGIYNTDWATQYESESHCKK
jgi:hypothetical protein